MKKLSPYLIWALLALPAVMMAPSLISGTGRDFHGLLHPTGEWSVRFLIASLIATPLMILTKGARIARWFRENRRYFGVAAFGYAALHTYVYVVGEGSLTAVLAELPKFDIWTGWAAFLIFVPLAITSNDLSVRSMGTWWKSLQRLTYGAAILAFLHWASLDGWRGTGAALVNFAPILALTLYRFWWMWSRHRSRLSPTAA
jgi:methionine sulfoxide reductase heme-binding subunit